MHPPTNLVLQSDSAVPDQDPRGGPAEANRLEAERLQRPLAVKFEAVGEAPAEADMQFCFLPESCGSVLIVWKSEWYLHHSS